MFFILSVVWYFDFDAFSQHALFFYIFGELGQFLIMALIKCITFVLYCNLFFLPPIDLSFNNIVVTDSACHITCQRQKFDFCSPFNSPAVQNMAYLCWYWHPDIVVCCFCYLHWVWWGSILKDGMSVQRRIPGRVFITHKLLLHRERSNLRVKRFGWWELFFI